MSSDKALFVEVGDKLNLVGGGGLACCVAFMVGAGVGAGEEVFPNSFGASLGELRILAMAASLKATECQRGLFHQARPTLTQGFWQARHSADGGGCVWQWLSQCIFGAEALLLDQPAPGTVSKACGALRQALNSLCDL